VKGANHGGELLRRFAANAEANEQRGDLRGRRIAGQDDVECGSELVGIRRFSRGEAANGAEQRVVGRTNGH
jgi:hypothetical protein